MHLQRGRSAAALRHITNSISAVIVVVASVTCKTSLLSNTSRTSSSEPVDSSYLAAPHQAEVPAATNPAAVYLRSTAFTHPPTHPYTQPTMSGDQEREHALEAYKSKLLESREWEAKLKALRLEIKGLQHDFDVSEENIKALQSVGQIIGEVLKQLDEERCMF